MPRRRILYICHNHPSVRPGGAEIQSLDLYEAMRGSEEFEPFLLARTGPPTSVSRWLRQGTPLGGVNGDPNQYFFYTDPAEFDWFYNTSRNKDVYTKTFAEFIAAIQPDIVHFQHTHMFGYDIVLQTRRLLPDAPLLYTLHEFLPICHRDGQMLRTFNDECCTHASPRRCHECFPEISPQAFFMRKRFIQSHLAHIDLFLAPSHFLRERFIEWGIPPEKILHYDIGRRAIQPLPDEERRLRNRFGFFGQFSHYKGINVLLKAMQILGREGVDVRLSVHGANQDLQGERFRKELEDLLEATRRNVTFVGSYQQGELARYMARIDWVIVPSIWWENSPLTIHEAFSHGRPVLCSDIGGMAEKVADGVNGLHFAAGDPESLARTVRRAARTPGLWEMLRMGIPPALVIGDSAIVLSKVYRELLAQRAARRSGRHVAGAPEGSSVPATADQAS